MGEALITRRGGTGRGLKLEKCNVYTDHYVDNDGRNYYFEVPEEINIADIKGYVLCDYDLIYNSDDTYHTGWACLVGSDGSPLGDIVEDSNATSGLGGYGVRVDLEERKIFPTANVYGDGDMVDAGSSRMGIIIIY